MPLFFFVFIDEHILMKTAYMTGCLILGFTFLEDWEVRELSILLYFGLEDLPYLQLTNSLDKY